MAVDHVTNCTDEQTMMIVGELVNILLLFYLFIYIGTKSVFGNLKLTSVVNV